MSRPLAIAMLAISLSACGAIPRGEQQSAPQAPAATQSVIVASAQAQQCLAVLSGTGSRFTSLPDRYLGSGCSNLNTVQLSDLSGDVGRFAISNIGPVHCPTATAFAGWARFGVDRAARQILGSPLDRIETMGSYSCRNVAGTGRRSAHSLAQAIDVSGFVLQDGRRVTVLGDWSNGDEREREFLRVVRRSACKRFGTVLSPDYNAAHRDHFHLERGDGTFCR